MSKSEIEMEMTAKIDVEDFAQKLADASSEDQGAFFEEFFVALESGCTGNANGLHWQLKWIVKEMGLCSRDVLEKMGEISKNRGNQ